MLPNQLMAGTGGVMEWVRAAVQARGIVHEGDPSGTLTVSAGIAAGLPGHRVSNEQILAEADDGMYAAKAAGTNTVVLADTATGALA